MRVSRVSVAGLAIAALGAAGYLVLHDTAPHPTPAPRATPASSRTPVLPAYDASGPLPAARGIEAVLASALRDRALGGSVSAVVLDARTGAEVYARGATAEVPPASTAKLVTSAAALTVLGPLARLETKVVLDGDRVVLVGGGDPTLAGPRSADRTAGRLTSLAADTAAALRARHLTSVAVGYDASLFTGPRTGSGWRPGYVSDGDIAPVTALAVDEGRVDPRRQERVSDPPLAAGRAFAALLAKSGVRVVGALQSTRAPDPAPVLATVRSAPVAALVEHLLTVSDNDLAEALARHVALRTSGPGSFVGGAAAVTEVLGRLGLPDDDASLVDGSGLSRNDRLTPRLLARLLALAASPNHPALRPLVTGLPVAGFTGTLADRYRRAPALSAAGEVRAKTGTLAGVSSLAGLLLDRDGRLLAFAVVADLAPSPEAAEDALDRLAARLATCGCR